MERWHPKYISLFSGVILPAENHNLIGEMDLSDRQKWNAFLKGLKSCDRYDRAVQKHLDWAANLEILWDDPRNLDRYLDEAHDRYLNNPKADNSFCGKTCWSIGSMIIAYFKQVRNVDAMQALSSIQNNLKKWQKTESIK